MRNFALPLDVSVKQSIHHDRSARVGKQGASQSDESAARHAKFDANPPIAMIVHIGYFTFARANMLHDYANKFFGNIDGEVFDRLHQFAVDAFGDDLRLPDHEFVALAAHHLDQNGKLQLAAAQNFERIGAASLFHAKRDVSKKFFVEALTQVSRCNEIAFASAKRRSVDGEEHRNRRLVDDDRRKGRGIYGAGNGLANGDALDASYGDDVAQRSFRNVGALEPGKTEQLGDLRLVKRSVALGDGNILAGFHGAGKNARDGQAAKVVAVIEIRDENLQRPIFVALGRRNRINDRLEQQAQIFARRSLVHGGGAGLGVGVKNRKVQLLFLGVKINKKVVNLVKNFLRTSVWPVNLINHQNRL